MGEIWNINDVLRGNMVVTGPIEGINKAVNRDCRWATPILILLKDLVISVQMATSKKGTGSLGVVRRGDRAKVFRWPPEE